MPLILDARGLPTDAKLAIEQKEFAKARELLGDKRFEISLRPDDVEQPLRDDTIRVELGQTLPAGLVWLARFGLSALYFTLLSSGRRVTLGKRLLGLEVVRLDGTPMSRWEAFERFGGYATVPGTAMLGLLDYFREPNGRPAHDRVSGTGVLMTEKPPSKEEP
jgi:uncharacterized RDD family membrane protein YckC